MYPPPFYHLSHFGSVGTDKKEGEDKAISNLFMIKSDRIAYVALKLHDKTKRFTINKFCG